MNKKIAAILQVYKRPQYLKEQYEAVVNQTIKPSEIIIVHNDDGKIEFDYPEIDRLFYASPNQKYHLRFAIGLIIDTDYLAFFDDDTIPGKKWFENCLNTIEKHNCICVANGRNVLPNGEQTCPAGWRVPNEKEVQVFFGGHAWFFRKDVLKYMWMEEPILYNNCEDVMLSANAMRFGNIPTFVPPCPENNLDLWGGHPIKSNEYGSDENASYIINSKHYPERKKVILEYLKRGWKITK